jgi:hypothetical protein
VKRVKSIIGKLRPRLRADPAGRLHSSKIARRNHSPSENGHARTSHK